MAAFASLPDHIILLILQHLPNDSLLPLATVSKSLHRCSVHRIYRYVHLWEKPDSHPNVPDWSSRHLHMSDEGLGRPPPWDTRIYHPSLFLRTISKSEVLRSCVAGVSFSCRLDQEETAFQIIELLGPLLQDLHIKRTLAAYDQDAGYLPAVSCLEIEIPAKSEINTETGDLRDMADKKKIYSLFDLPKITLLSLSGVRNWNLLIQDSNITRSGTSSITRLSFTDTVPADQGLAEVLSWPKTLKSLWYQLVLSEIHRRFFGPVLPGRAHLSAKEFSSVLKSQEQNLEELFIYGDTDGDCCGFEPEETIDLHSFTQLQYVGLPLTFLFISEEEATSRSISTHIPSISEILPLSLQELQIEIPYEYEYSYLTYFSCEPDNDLHLAPGELSAFVCEIVRNKGTQFTKLRTIVFWQWDVTSPGTTYNLEDEDCSSEVVEACKAAQIQISWVVGSVPPLFGSSLWGLRSYYVIYMSSGSTTSFMCWHEEQGVRSENGWLPGISTPLSFFFGGNKVV